MSAQLDIENISRSFGDVKALDDTTLNVPAGSFLALLGPSGCGKTTTLRIVAGFELPDNGTVRIGGQDMLLLPPNKRNLGMMFQDYALFPHMTVGENVAFGLKMKGVAKADRDRRIRDALEQVRLPNVEDRFPHQMSGGQRQRVALARSLVTQPSVLLLDEPLSALDKNLRESMQFELKRLQSTIGLTTVMVTHDQEEALTLADEIAVMNKGRILQIGSPDDVYDSPNNRFVSEFLGAANLLTGKRESTTARHMLLGTGDNGPRLALPLFENIARKIVLGVRPEKMQLSKQPLEIENCLECRIEAQVFRGATRAYELSCAAIPDRLLAYQQSSSRLGTSVFVPGETVWAGWRAEDSFAFPFES